MEITTFTTTILTAREGCFLTQSDESTPIAERIIAKRIALGKGDKEYFYKEITAEEAEALKAEMGAE